MRVPVDIVSGFLGAGKTTLISKLLKECYQQQKIFLLENEYGQVGIDGALLARPDVEMKEIYSGCICCSLKGDFTRVLLDALEKVKPQRVIIEPTGVGKLSEIISVLEQDIFKDKLTADRIITVVDAQKAPIYLRNFGEFFKDQVRHAKTLILSKTGGLEWQAIQELIKLLRPLNPGARWITTPWEQLTGEQIFNASAPVSAFLTGEVPRLKFSLYSKTGSHCGCQGTHHLHDHHRGCSSEHHHTVGHNTAPDIFQSWAWESPKVFDESSLRRILTDLGQEKRFGQVLRAKGIVPGKEGWHHFEYVSGDWQITAGSPQITGRAAVIGVDLQECQLNNLFEGLPQ